MADWLRGMSVGQWYQAGDEDPFEVIAVDVRNETILVQHFDGTLADFDFDAWMELGARQAAQPEDWSGALDMDREDYGVDPDIIQIDRWSDPLDYLDSRH